MREQFWHSYHALHGKNKSKTPLKSFFDVILPFIKSKISRQQNKINKLKIANGLVIKDN